LAHPALITLQPLRNDFKKPVIALLYLAFVVEKWFLSAKKELLYNPPQSRLKFNPCHKPLYEQPE
jgi:hypothetical protein